MHSSSTNKFLYFGKLERVVKIVQKHGIHLAPSSVIATLVNCSQKDIFVSSDKLKPTKLYPSLMQIFTLDLSEGSIINLSAEENYPKILFDAIANSFGAKDKTEAFAIKNKILSIPKSLLQ